MVVRNYWKYNLEPEM